MRIRPLVQALSSDGAGGGGGMMKVTVTDSLAHLTSGGRTTGPSVLDPGFTHLTLKPAEGLDRRVALATCTAGAPRRSRGSRCQGGGGEALGIMGGFPSTEPFWIPCAFLRLIFSLYFSFSPPHPPVPLFLLPLSPGSPPYLPVRKQSPLSLVGFP